MRKILKDITLNSLSIYIIATAVGALSYSNRLSTLILSGGALTFCNYLVKPLLNLLLLPINIITLGSFRWVVNALVLLIVQFIVSGFTIHAFSTPAVTTLGFAIPALTFSFLWTLFLVSFTIEVLTAIFKWLIK